MQIKGIRSLPPIYHILGNKTDTHPSVAATHELPHTMEADDIKIVYSHEIEVITDEENRKHDKSYQEPSSIFA